MGVMWMATSLCPLERKYISLQAIQEKTLEVQWTPTVALLVAEHQSSI